MEGQRESADGEPSASRDDELLALSQELRKLARRLARGDVTDDDLVQEAWLAALRESPERIRDLRGWLRVTLRNLARRDARRRVLREDSEHRAALQERTQLEEGRFDEESAQALRSSVAELREPFRVVVVLRYFEGLPIEEVARRLGRPIETIRTQQRRALALLRLSLSGRGDGRRSRFLLVWRSLRRRLRTNGGWRAAVTGLGAVAVVASLWLGFFAPGSPHEDRVASPSAMSELAQADEDAVDIANRAAVDVAVAESTTSPASSAETHISFKFRVVDFDGRAAAGARLEVRSSRPKAPVRAIADRDGRCTLNLPVSELANIVASPGSRGQVGVWAFLDDRVASPVHIIDSALAEREFEIRLGGPAVRLAGRVVDEAGVAVPHAVVELALLENAVATNSDGVLLIEAPVVGESDEEGRFELPHAAPGAHSYSASASGFATTIGSIGPSTAPATIVLSRGCVLVGAVTLPDGAPAAGARVTLGETGVLSYRPPVATCDARGRYRLSGAPPGRSWVFAQTSESLLAAASLNLAAEVESTWNAQLKVAPPIEILVLDSSSSPVLGAAVLLDTTSPDLPSWIAGVQCDADGRALFVTYPPTELRYGVLVGPNAGKVLESTLIASELDGPLVLSVDVGSERPSAAAMGHVLDDDGAPMRDGVVVLAAYGSPAALRLPVAADSGQFRTEAAPLGERHWIAAGSRGVVDLGPQTLYPESLFDMGQVRALPAGEVKLLWRAPPTADEQWSLHWSLDIGARVVKGKLRNLAPESQSIPLYPGQYQIDVRRADGAGRYVVGFVIGSGETLEVEVR